MENMIFFIFPLKYEMLSKPRVPDKLGSLFLGQGSRVHVSSVRWLTATLLSVKTGVPQVRWGPRGAESGPPVAPGKAASSGSSQCLRAWAWGLSPSGLPGAPRGSHELRRLFCLIAAARWLCGLTWLRPPSARGLAASAQLQLPTPPQRPHPPPPQGEAPSLHAVMQGAEMESSSLVCSRTKQPPPHCGCLLETLLQTLPGTSVQGTPAVRPLQPW